jgi:tRNA1Val (adenine37-N6)-methyltransferase
MSDDFQSGEGLLGPGLDPAMGPFTDDRLTRDVRILQRAKGHRFSVDDIITAFVANRRRKDARRILDMGCGIGSVLLHLAWDMTEATLVGIEAQDVSFAIALENVRRNGMQQRVSLVHGDLRDVTRTLAEQGDRFDLVTGTPPYFPPDTALDSMDAQRAYARIEYRGGVDDYVEAGARVLSPAGTLVLCGDARTEPRVQSACTTTGLFVVERVDIVAKAGKPPLFCVWVLERTESALGTSAIVLRDENGERTADAAMLKAFSGF